MPYVGNSPASNFASVTKDTFSGNGSTTAFTLSKTGTTNGVAVFVENVRQEPTTAYAVSGTTLTFTAAPVSGTNNIYVLHHNAPASTATHPSAQALTATSGTFTGAFTSLGIDDNADATAITIDSSENVGIGIAPGFNVQIDKSSTDTSLGGLTDAQLVLSNTGSATTNQHVKLGFRFQDGSLNGQAMIAAVRESNSARSTSLRFYSAPSSDGDPDEAIAIDSNGHVTMPKQSAFYAYHSSSPNNLAADTYVDILYDTERFDNNNDFNPSNGTFTAPVTGKYQFNMSFRFQNTVSDHTYIYLQFNSSNSNHPIILASPGFHGDAELYVPFTGSALLDMDANDTCKVRFYQQGGSATIDVGYQYFDGHLVC